jgi:hypothetical protein
MRLQAHRAVVAALVREDEETERYRREAFDVMDEVVRRAQAEGSLRADVGLGDLAVLFVSVVLQPHDLAPEAAGLAPGRVLGIMLDGLRARDAGVLPGRPLTRADLGMRR